MKSCEPIRASTYFEFNNRATEKTQMERDTLEEVWEELAATDRGTRYYRRERVSIRSSKETEVEVR